MFWCCSSLACSWGYMETIACHSFPLRVFPERAPGITRKSEKCSLDWVRAPLKSEDDVFLCTWWVPASPQWGFFTSSGAQGSGKHSGGSGLLGDFEHKGLCEWPRSWAKQEVKSRALCHCPHQSEPMESTAGIMQLLSEAHSLTQNLRGLDVLTQTSPQPIYILAQGQVSIPDLINGADRSGFLSERGKLNSIKPL